VIAAWAVIRAAIIFDLIEWLSARDRNYEEVIEIWRTSCPKLSVWGDCKDRGFVAHKISNAIEFHSLPARLISLLI